MTEERDSKIMNPGDWVRVAKISEVPDGETIGVVVGELQVALFNVSGGFYATSNICTHAYAKLSDGWLEGDVIECPLHGGCFDVKSGKALGPPVDRDIQTYRTRLVDEFIEVEVP